MPSSIVDQIASLDLAASIDPVIVSADPEIRRSSARAFTVRDATPDDFFVVDALNRRIGIEGIDGQGIFVPSVSLQAEYEGATMFWFVDLYGTGADNFEFAGRKSEGTKAVPTALTDDSDMWEFSARGYDGVGFSGQQAVILFEAAGAWTGISHGTRAVHKTTEQGTTTQVEVLVLGDDGCVVVTGQTNGLIGAVAGEFLRVNGGSRFNGDMAMSGDFTFAPTADNDGNVGTAALRFTLVRAVTITAGDLTFENGWRFTEDYEDDGMVLKNRMGREMFAVRESGLYIMGRKAKSIVFDEENIFSLVA